MDASSVLFRPVEIGGRRLKNRLVALPVYTGYAHPGGRVSSLMTAHYGRLAESGVAMVVVANAAVAASGVVSTHNLRADADTFVPGLSRLAGAIHDGGALACLQLNHAGRFARTDQPLLPCALDAAHIGFQVAALRDFMNFFPLEKRFGLTRRLARMAAAWTRAMTADERDGTVAAFGAAAARAHAAGFDMVELHGAGGYLLCQFLSSSTNRPDGEAGGDLADRAAFPLRVLRAVRRRLPAGFPVGYRLITREWVPDGIDPAQAAAFAGMLGREGVDYVSVSAGTYLSMLSPPVRGRMARPGYLREDAAALRRRLGVPVIVSGRITRPELAARLVSEGTAQLVGLGRPLRVDPDWVRKARGDGSGVRACVNCNACLKRVVLDQGFNCRRWPRPEQERTDLELRLLGRNYRGLLVAARMRDLDRLAAALPHLLPDPRALKALLSPTLLVLTGREGERRLDAGIDPFCRRVQHALDAAGFDDALLHTVVRRAEASPEREVERQVRTGDHGMVFIPRGDRYDWRLRVAFRLRGKTLGLIGANDGWRRILVPVDLSMSTLLVMMFLKRTFLTRAGVAAHFVHFHSEPVRLVEQRWARIRELADLGADLPLRLIASRGDVAGELLELLRTERYDAVVMGRRGRARIKRWLPGSVSAALLRELTEASLFLVD